MRLAGEFDYRPPLIFNTAMGVAYITAAMLIWRDLSRGRIAAAVILTLNLAMLGVVGYLFHTGEVLVVESVRAMAFRSTAWLVIFGVLVWIGRRQELST